MTFQHVTMKQVFGSLHKEQIDERMYNLEATYGFKCTFEWTTLFDQTKYHKLVSFLTEKLHLTTEFTFGFGADYQLVNMSQNTDILDLETISALFVSPSVAVWLNIANYPSYTSTAIIPKISFTVKSHNEDTVASYSNAVKEFLLDSKWDFTVHLSATVFKYDSDKKLNCSSIRIASPTEAKDSNYPFIKRGIKESIGAFLSSKASVLLLYGNPGTGKTEYIRHIMQSFKESHAGVKHGIYYAPDHSIITSPEFYSLLFERCTPLLVIMEDVDTSLEDRRNGNDMMYSLLGVSNGIVNTVPLKIVISTNLPNLSQIDPALIRRGRCFDTVEFVPLKKKEAIQMLTDHEADPNLVNHPFFSQEPFTLANLYAAINGELDQSNQIRLGAGFK